MVRYILWFYIVMLIAAVLICGIYAISTMRKTMDVTVGVTKEQIDNRVENTLKLLTSLSYDESLMNDNIAIVDKAKSLINYSKTMNYMMIRLVDKDANVWTERGTQANLGTRDYMQRLFATGEAQVTDSFAAGADGATLNYTLAVPIKRDQQVAGCLFAAIYFTEISERLSANLAGQYQELTLFGSNNQVMSSTEPTRYGKSYIELSKNVWLIGTTGKQAEASMFNQGSGSHWAINGGDLVYATYQPIVNTQWTVFGKQSFWGTFYQFLPQLLAWLFISTIAYFVLTLLANRYIRLQMGTVDMLVESVQELEKKIYQHEKPDNVDFKEIINLTSKGLTDGLTGVITRTVLLNQIPNKLKNLADDKFAAICFVDLDNLKKINDTYGHSIGDMTLKNVGYVLREYEKKYDGLVGRHGGDEFIILLTGFDSLAILTEIIEELTLRLRCEVTTDNGVLLHTQCSIGVTVCNEAMLDAQILIQQADEALYFVKRNKKGWYKFYSEL